VGHVTLDAPLDKINLHLRGGYIFPCQTEDINTDARCVHSLASKTACIDTNNCIFLFINHSRKNSFRLIVAIGADGKANGDLFWDDGDSAETISSERYTYLTFSYLNANITQV
jgi:alpha-glucosidase (family GH31 glycosyl hydrolase)